MNLVRKAGLVAGPVTAVLMLAGCNSGTSSASAAQGGGSSAPASSAASAPAAPSSAPAATATASASAASGTGDTCSAAEMTIQAGVGGGAGAQANGDAVNQWNLYSKATCTMDGYPGVDLIGIDTATGQQTRLSVPRATDESPAEVTVDGSNDGGFGIEYKPGANPKSELKVTKMIVTPPNAYDQLGYKVPSSGWAIAMTNGQVDAHVEPVTSGGHN